MDIQKVWKQQNTVGNDLPDITSVSQLYVPQQVSPLKRMKKILVANTIWACLITLCYLAILCLYHYWQIQGLMLLVLVFNVWAIHIAWKLNRQVDAEVTAENLLTELKRNQAALKQWMQVQTKVALFIYPFSACAGFMLGGVLGSGKSVGFFMTKHWVFWIMVGVAIILTPVCHWLAKWMFNRSFGKVVAHLEQAIAQLSSPE